LLIVTDVNKMNAEMTSGANVRVSGHSPLKLINFMQHYFGIAYITHTDIRNKPLFTWFRPMEDSA
jgi:hypothetical protein